MFSLQTEPFFIVPFMHWASASNLIVAPTRILFAGTKAMMYYSLIVITVYSTMMMLSTEEYYLECESYTTSG